MRRTKTNSRWSTSIASPSAFMFHKTRNLKDSRRTPDSDRFTSRTTFRIGFEKCCHSPSGFCEPVEFVEYALEYFEISCVVVEIVERDMDADLLLHVPRSTFHLYCFRQSFSNRLAASISACTFRVGYILGVSDRRARVFQCLNFRKPTVHVLLHGSKRSARLPRTICSVCSLDFTYAPRHPSHLSLASRTCAGVVFIGLRDMWTPPGHTQTPKLRPTLSGL
jgi:hypothetical protein